MGAGKHGKRKNIYKQYKTLAKTFIPVLMLFCIISGIILNSTYRQRIGHLNDMANLYIDEIDNRFFRISRRILVLMLESNNAESRFKNFVSYIKEGEDEVLANHAVSRLKDDFLQYRWEYGTEYNFFLYFEEGERYLELSFENGILQNESQLSLIESIKNTSNQAYSIKQKWEALLLEQGNYIYKVVHLDGVYLGCYLDVKSILEPFKEIDIGKSGYVELILNDRTKIATLANKKIHVMTEEYEHSPILKKNMIVTKSFARAAFTIQIYNSNINDQAVMTGIMLSLMCIAILLLGSYIWTLFYLRKFILRPVEKFVSNLQEYNDDNYFYSLNENNIIELEQADEKFRNMFHQIKKLKISLYEQELEKQKVEMDYLKMQIRPHFFLNNLNFIYSMIVLDMHEQAKKMAMITSEYLQNIFKSSTETVKIKEEMAHCRKYLEMLMMRYKDGFEYYIEQDEETMDVETFPFFIQVFVENAVKHALSLDTLVLISVTVFPEEINGEDYVNIYISDTGKGFSKEELLKLRGGESLSDKKGNHLGINNCIKRLHYFYGDKGKINFENSPLGGAVVDIHIPKTICRSAYTRGENHDEHPADRR